MFIKKIRFTGVSAAIFLLLCVYVHAEDIQLSGTVTNGSGDPVSEAQISFPRYSLQTQTDSEGNFQLSGSSPVITKKKLSKGSYVLLQKSNISLNLLSSSNVELAVFNLNGKKLYAYTSDQLNPGIHSIEVPFYKWGNGTYLVSVAHEGQKTSLKHIYSMKGYKNTDQTLKTSNFKARTVQLLKSTAGEPDTLVITAQGYKTGYYQLASLTESGIDIVLEKDGITINEINIEENSESVYPNKQMLSVTFSDEIYFDRMLSTPSITITDSEDNQVSRTIAGPREDDKTGFDIYAGDGLQYSSSYKLLIGYRNPQDFLSDIYEYRIEFSTVSLEDVEVATLPAAVPNLNWIRGIAVSENGEVLITRSKTDHTQSFIEKLNETEAGYEKIAGSEARGRDDGSVEEATMEAIRGITIDYNGTVYFTSTPATGSSYTKSVRMLKENEISTIYETKSDGVSISDVAVKNDGSEIYFFTRRVQGTTFHVYNQVGEGIRSTSLIDGSGIDFGDNPIDNPDDVRAVEYDMTNDLMVFAVGNNIYTMTPEGEDVNLLASEEQEINLRGIAIYNGVAYYSFKSGDALTNRFCVVKKVPVSGGDSEVYVGADAVGPYDGDRENAGIIPDSNGYCGALAIVTDGDNAGTLYIVNGKDRIVRVKP
ncbi:MAG: carboxypeptidase regulatory-like domain-containing protein [Fibrobacter sp.]|nr:carboxypeptidase regulatory-like domain-containing protein [Fibrobacter sp.]